MSCRELPSEASVPDSQKTVSAKALLSHKSSSPSSLSRSPQSRPPLSLYKSKSCRERTLQRRFSPGSKRVMSAKALPSHKSSIPLSSSCRPQSRPPLSFYKSKSCRELKSKSSRELSKEVPASDSTRVMLADALKVVAMSISEPESHGRIRHRAVAVGSHDEDAKKVGKPIVGCRGEVSKARSTSTSKSQEEKSAKLRTKELQKRRPNHKRGGHEGDPSVEFEDLIASRLQLLKKAESNRELSKNNLIPCLRLFDAVGIDSANLEVQQAARDLTKQGSCALMVFSSEEPDNSALNTAQMESLLIKLQQARSKVPKLMCALQSFVEGRKLAQLEMNSLPPAEAS